MKKASDYLEGLGLPRIQSTAEERAALHAWNAHDAATGVPSVAAMVGVVAGLAVGELLGGALVGAAGALLTGLIYLHDGGRVMAEAVLKVRDTPRPSLELEPGSPGPPPVLNDAAPAAPATAPEAKA